MLWSQLDNTEFGHAQDLKASRVERLALVHVIGVGNSNQGPVTLTTALVDVPVIPWTADGVVQLAVTVLWGPGTIGELVSVQATESSRVDTMLI